MSYIGNTPTNQNFVAGADQFSGTGSQTVFTLSRNVNTVFDIFVAISNVPQDPYSAYSVSGSTLTFTSAPPSGTGNIYVTYRATNVQTFVPSPGVSQQFSIGTAASPAITFIGDTNTGIYSPGADTLAFVEGGTEAMRINSSANVGIGTSSPNNSLTVSRSGADVARFVNSGSNGGDWQFKIGGGGFEDRRLMITDKFSGADNVRVGIDSNGNFQFNSGYGSAAVAYGCRAWVNFNGTGTVAIRASGNVSSITDNGTGDYTVNFATAMPDANYAVNAISQQGSGDAAPNGVVALKNAATITTSAVRLIVGTPTVGANDRDYVFVSIFR
jgi:hypothetical protein